MVGIMRHKLYLDTRIERASGEYPLKVVLNYKDYPDFVIPKQEIFSYNLVVGLIRL